LHVVETIYCFVVEDMMNKNLKRSAINADFFLLAFTF